MKYEIKIRITAFNKDETLSAITEYNTIEHAKSVSEAFKNILQKWST